MFLIGFPCRVAEWAPKAEGPVTAHRAQAVLQAAFRRIRAAGNRKLIAREQWLYADAVLHQALGKPRFRGKRKKGDEVPW